MNALDRRGNIFETKSTGQNKLAGLKAVSPLPRECRAGTAVTRRPRIKQIKIGGKMAERHKRRPFFQAKGFDDFDPPAKAIFRVLFAMKLRREISWPSTGELVARDHIGNAFSRFVHEQRHIERVRRQALDNFSGLLRREKTRARRIKIESEHVRAELERFLRVSQARNAANFDLDAHKARKSSF